MLLRALLNTGPRAVLGSRLAWLLCSALLLGQGAAAESGKLNLHLEPAVALQLAAPQTSYFGTGFSLDGKLDYRLVGPLSAQATLSYLSFSPGPGYDAWGQAFAGGAGFRVRLLDDQVGYALHLGDRPRHEGNWFGNLWLDATAQAVMTGPLLRFGYALALGVELSPLDHLQAGPLLKFAHVLQPDNIPTQYPDDAYMLLLGVSVSWAAQDTTRHPLPKVEAPPPPPPPPPAVVAVPVQPEPAPVRVPQTARVFGRVTNLKDEPLEAAVHLPTIPELADKAFEASPEYEVVVQPGEHRIEASAPGYLIGGSNFKVEAGDSLRVDIRLRPMPTVKAAHLTAQRIEITQTIQFEHNRARILPGSFYILDEVVDILLRNPSLRIRVEGHTDATGEPEYNMELSRSRATAVRLFLVERGVEPSRLTSEGFGRTRPIASNRTKGGRAKNRRVQFEILASEQPAPSPEP